MARIVIVVLLSGAIAHAAAAASADPDGRYRGNHVGGTGKKLTQTVSFHVSADGRRITRLRTTASTFCVGPTLFDNRIFIAPVYVRRIRVAASGRFRSVTKPARRTRVQVSGRLRGRRAAGRIDVRIANCSARDRFVARRVGR